MLQKVGGPVGSLPIVVLTSGAVVDSSTLPAEIPVQAVNDAWAELQRDLASLSSRSKHILVEDSGHYINIERPHLVVDAIRAIVSNHRLEMLYAPASSEVEVST